MKLTKSYTDSQISGVKSQMFSGDYNDLTNKPTIPTVPASLKNPYALTFTGAATGSYNGSAAKTVNIPTVPSSLPNPCALTITSGTAITAYDGSAAVGITMPTVFVKSGSGAAAGLVPAPSTTAGTTKYLREDGTWAVPPNTNTIYTHPTYTAKAAGLYKITVDGTGHVSAATAVTKADITALGCPYLPLAGGIMTGAIQSSVETTTYLAGNRGSTIINSTASAGSYTMLAKMNSTNGYFTHGTYQTKYLLQYTASDTVTAGTNAVTKSLTLLDESGNSSFPGTVTASSFNGNASTATALTTSAGSATQPVYFSSGKPVAGTYTLNKSVPANAVFTDTVYTHPSYTARTGVPTANQTPAFGGTFTVSQPISDGSGHITSINSRTITIPSTAASASAAGLMSAADKSKLDAITASADAVSFSRSLTSGTKIGTITINGVGTDLYCQTNTDTNTTYSAGTGISLSGTTFSNSGVRAIGTGTSNGTISVNTNGTTANVAVKGLGSAAYTASTAYAAASHTHRYLPLSGGNITGSICPTTDAKIDLGTTSHRWNCVAAYILRADAMYVTSTTGNISICSNALQSRNYPNNAWAPCYASAFTTQSSIRYKENVEPLSEDKINQIMDYQVVSYDYINSVDGTDCMGMIAEDVAEINKFPVVFDSNGQPDGLDYSKFVPQLIGFCQILRKEVDSLKEEINELKKIS